MSQNYLDQTGKWFYAVEEAWQAFTDEDDEALEAKWRSLVEDGSLAKSFEEQKSLNDDKQEQERKEESNADNSTVAAPAPSSGADEIMNRFYTVLEKSKIITGEEQKDEKKREKVIVDERLDPDATDENRKFRVEVMEDHLFDVDLEKMNIFPAFWKGALLKVVRATWFFSTLSSGDFAPIPYNEGLSYDLELAYERAKPWERSSRTEETEKGKTDEQQVQEAERYALPSMDNRGEVSFQDASSGRIYTQDLAGKLMSVIGGSLVIRGWEETARRSKVSMLPLHSYLWSAKSQEDEDSGDSTGGSKVAQSKEGAAKAPSKAFASTSGTEGEGGESKQSDGGFFSLWPKSENVLRPGYDLLRALGWSKKDATEEEQRATKQRNTESRLKNDSKADETKGTEQEESFPDDLKDEPPELVLAIHGIGQKMVEDWDAIDFIYDVEKLRKVANKMAADSALKRLARGRRAQFLPISWRRDLVFEGDGRKCNDNHYTLDDISNSATIPIVRSVISKVVLDVPYYLSRHKAKMVEGVVDELNRVYRLFVRRNPDFEEKGGRVSLIGHSLGSSLIADVLSAQPTVVLPLSQQSKESLTSNKSLLFNVKNLFLIGSPNAFFFHLEGAQMMARKRMSGPQNVSDDANDDGTGGYACLAAEAIYNYYNSTDPVALQLSPTVDAYYARVLESFYVPDAASDLLEELARPRLSLKKLFDPDNSFVKASDAVDSTEKSSGREDKSNDEKAGKAATRKEEKASSRSKFDLERLQKAERRYRAINPHGCLDFIHESGGFNQYIDMLSAHTMYWSSENFANFLLVQLFGDFGEGKGGEGKDERGGGGGAEVGNRDAGEEDEDEEDDDDSAERGEREESGGTSTLSTAISLPGIV
ncbi:hypothetical protein CBS101457_002016 [Exobasidium rhododendri]|nr:hypothetical protein CBS101457_002016 [Exobasidium rhododendri]